MITCLFFFFFNDTATTEIYTLSLHDALPISGSGAGQVRFHRDQPQLLDGHAGARAGAARGALRYRGRRRDRKSTRLKSSHSQISYAVFCLEKKKQRSTFARLLNGWNAIFAPR